MTRLHKKLLVIFCALVCTLCLCLGITACNTAGKHTHTFDGFWLFDGADGHYRFATCHPDVKSEKEPHVDENQDNKCDVCGYVMHEHTDVDGDNVCDECEQEIHKHEFSDEWTFSENKHWHEATCEHFTERSDYVAHSFSGGVCECGVKESEVKVYDLYKNSPEYELFFTQWLDWLESNGITVEYTESGDGIYHYADHSEVRFLGERTVKVKAVADGNALADVWFMVAMYNTEEKGYYENKGTIALGIAKTGANGVAEVTFRPAGGYSSATIEYRIRIAERKDIAVFEGVDEENASLAFPNRYVVKGGNAGFEYKPVEVSENANGDDIAATIEFNYSKGWNAYNTLELPYKRYYEDLINGTGLKEECATYQFTSSGDNLFDYFIFSPAEYSFAGSTSVEDNAKIEENAKLAASGVYTITFTVNKNANAELYFWDKEGVNLGAFHYTNSDGEPLDSMYLTEKSGDNNFVTVTIKPEYGLRLYQLGIKTDTECNVTVTVERISDIGVDYTFEWDSQAQKSELTIRLPMDELLTFGLEGVPEGLYVLTLPNSPKGSGQSDYGRFYTWTDDEQKMRLFEPQYWQDVYGLQKGVIRVTEDTKFIYLYHTMGARENVKITLEKYELPTVTNEFVAVPVTPSSYQNSYTLSLSITAGSYKLSVWVQHTSNGGADKPLSVYIGNTLYTLENPSDYMSGGNVAQGSDRHFYTYTGEITIGEDDKTITIMCSGEYSFFAGVQFTIPHECKDVCSECNKCLTDCKEPECADKCKGHVGEDGVYKDFGELTLVVGAISNQISLKDLEAKRYYLIAETESTPASGNLSIMIYGKSATAVTGDLYAPVSQAYKCWLEVTSDWLKTNYCYIQIKNTSGEEIKIISLKIVEFEEFTVEADKEYEITAGYGSLGFNYLTFDEALAGKKIKLTVTNFTGEQFLVYYRNGSKDVKLTTITSSDEGFVGELTVPDNLMFAFLDGDKNQLQNVVIKIEIVED